MLLCNRSIKANFSSHVETGAQRVILEDIVSLKGKPQAMFLLKTIQWFPLGPGSLPNSSQGPGWAFLVLTLLLSTAHSSCPALLTVSSYSCFCRYQRSPRSLLWCPVYVRCPSLALWAPFLSPLLAFTSMGSSGLFNCL